MGFEFFNFSFIFVKARGLWAFFSFSHKSVLTETSGTRNTVYSIYVMSHMFQMLQTKKFGAS